MINNVYIENYKVFFCRSDKLFIEVAILFATHIILVNQFASPACKVV